MNASVGHDSAPDKELLGRVRREGPITTLDMLRLTGVPSLQIRVDAVASLATAALLYHKNLYTKVECGTLWACVLQCTDAILYLQKLQRSGE